MKQEETNFVIKLQKIEDLENISEYDIVKEILLRFKTFFDASNVSWKLSEYYNDEYNLNNEMDGVVTEILYDEKKNTYLRIYNPKKNISNEAKEIIKSTLRSLLSIIDLKRQVIDSEYNRHLDSTFNIQNRDAFSELVNNLKECKNIGICFIDANNLKGLNDTYGHNEGDNLLKAISLSMKKIFKFNDVFRIGGDEFIIVSKQPSKEEFYKKVNNVKKLIEQMGYSASIGATYTSETNDISKEILLAEKLMYEDKKEYYKNNFNERSRFSKR